MAYSKTVWTDRAVQYPSKFTSATNADGTITLTPSPGTITNAGTPLTSANLNNMENGIANAVVRTGDTMTGDLILSPQGTATSSSSYWSRLYHMQASIWDSTNTVAKTLDGNMQMDTSGSINWYSNGSGTNTKLLKIDNLGNPTFYGTSITVNGNSVLQNVAPTWTSITLLNGWVRYDGGSPVPAYRLLPWNLVQLKGYIKSGTTGTICNLPSGYRPAIALDFPVISSSGYSSLYVNADGSVVITGTTPTSIRLDGIIFPTDQ